MKRSSLAVAILVSVAAPGASADEGTIEPGGRAFVRHSALKVSSPGADWRNELDIASARLVVNYEIGKTLKNQVEVELSDGDLELKDAYIRYRPIKLIRFQVGRFKRPISPLSMEGAWDLPMVERGVLNDRLTAGTLDIRFPFGGRTDGATVEVRPELAIDVRATAGVFVSRMAQSNVIGMDAFDDSEDLFEDVFGRVTAEVVDGFTIGATGAVYQRVRNTDGELNHAGLGSLDLTYDHDYVRAWLEAFYGRTPYVDPAVGRVRGAMWAGRLVVAPRIDEMVEVPVKELEPFVSLAVLEPSTIVRESRAIQAGGGLSVKVIKQLKLQIEYVHLDTQLQFPIASLNRLFVQVGSKF